MGCSGIVLFGAVEYSRCQADSLLLLCLFSFFSPVFILHCSEALFEYHVKAPGTTSVAILWGYC
eukprot:4764380-Amphidinium_carterae.1